MRRPICVIGLGLIGGSLLRAAEAAGRKAWGAAESEVDIQAAASDGFQVEPTVEDALRLAAQQDAMVVLAVPLPAVEPVLAAVTEFAPDCLLTDVVSVKAPVLAAVRRRAPQARYVGGHPMAGSSSSGWAASSASLFTGAAWVATVEDDTDLATWREVTELALACGAQVVPVAAEEHDAAVARVSHLPHVLAALLASVGADGGPLAMTLAAGSFADGTRVAGSRPELVRAMCEGNRAALLQAVDDALGRLGVARGALASTGSLRATIESGHQARLAVDARAAAPRIEVRLDLTAEDARDALRSLGAQGGRVTALDGAVALAGIPGE